MPVEGEPGFLAYDSGKGEIFEVGLTILEVISDSRNVVAANVTMVVGEKLVEGPLAYDSGKSEIFVANEANLGSGNAVYILSDVSESTSASYSPSVPEFSITGVILVVLIMVAGSFCAVTMALKNSTRTYSNSKQTKK